MGWPKGKLRGKGSRPDGAGRKPGKPTQKQISAQKFARSIIEDPQYQEMLTLRARNGTLNAATENMLFYYAYGKPPDTVRIGSEPGNSLEIYVNDPERRQQRIAELEAQLYGPFGGRRAGIHADTAN